MTGLATPHETDPKRGRFAMAKFSHGFVFLVTKGVTEEEDPLDKLSTVSANFNLTDEVIPLVSIVPQLSFRYCNWYASR